MGIWATVLGLAFKTAARLKTIHALACAHLTKIKVWLEAIRRGRIPSCPITSCHESQNYTASKIGHRRFQIGNRYRQ